MSEPLDRTKFLERFDAFKADIQRHNGEVFTSFQSGLAQNWEGYKPKVRSIARQRLAFEQWETKDFGTGRILDAVIRAIEIRESQHVHNNLVAWEPRPHQPSVTTQLRSDLATKVGLHKFERLVFSVFNETLPAEVFISGVVDLLGRRYSLIAYLLYVLDDQNFMPIAPTTFDTAFSELGLTLRMAGKCSWENYSAYNETIRSVQTALKTWAGLSDVRLIDAHSFLWMMVRVPQKIAQQVSQGLQKPDDLKWIMIEVGQDIVSRVANANGQNESRIVKNKELIGFSSHQALYSFLEDLWHKQRGVCALTGLQMQLKRVQGSGNYLLRSIDRISSDGHYSPDNLQWTCWFANRWKGTQDDAGFKKLLDLVRIGDGGQITLEDV